jgi:hypothetical protein
MRPDFAASIAVYMAPRPPHHKDVRWLHFYNFHKRHTDLLGGLYDFRSGAGISPLFA